MISKPVVKLFIFGAILVAPVGPVVRAMSPQQPSGAVASPSPEQALVSTYCVGCHNERNKDRVQGFVLTNLDPSKATEHREAWEKVVRKLRGGLMPPAGARRPENAALGNFAGYLESQLDKAAKLSPDPGRTATVRRLNRTEYSNAVRDLLGLSIDVTELLPADEAGGGENPFDNATVSLKLNDALVERYLSVAHAIGRAALGGSVTPEEAVYNGNPRQDSHLEGLPLGTRGGIRVQHWFPVDGEYEFRTKGGTADDVVFMIDGQIVNLDGKAASRSLPDARLALKAGPHVLVVTYANSDVRRELEGDRAPYANDAAGFSKINSVMIRGPFTNAGKGDTPSRRRILVCQPTSAAEQEGCARKILGSLARRAYRRPVTAGDVDRLIAFYKIGRGDGTFEAGIEAGVTALLSSPGFLLRVEAKPQNASAGMVYRISDLELASRLSFFLWSSIPDDELIDLASKGELKAPATLEKQVRRMLRDPKAAALTYNFAAQWLQIRNVKSSQVAGYFYPEFDESLREAFRQEIELFFDSVRVDDRNVLRLLDADYTFVNERLATHYGIPGITGAEFQRVTLPADSPRRGLLGKGSMLLVTSRPQRTSPVLRGKWILDNLLGTPPPPPPPNVPTLPSEQQNDGRVLTIREVLTRHRANPVCASCHSVIDPPGFGLEQFDPTGKFRTLDTGFKPLDASGVFPDGTKFEGVVGLRAVLLARPEQFLRTMTEKMLTYALGRSVDSADAPAVRRIVADAAKSDYRFSALILGVINSVPFEMQRVDKPEGRSYAAVSHER